MEVIPLNVVPLDEVSTATMPTTTKVEIPLATPLTVLKKTMEILKSMEEMNL